MARPKKSDADAADVLDGDLEVEETAAAPTAETPAKPTAVATDEDTVQILMRRTLPHLIMGPTDYGPLEARKLYKVPVHVADHLRSIDAA